MTLGVKGQGQTSLKSALRPLAQMPVSFFDEGYSYLAQLLLMMCRISRSFQFDNMTFESTKVKVIYT